MKSEKRERERERERDKPGRAGMAQEATGLGVFSTSTRHMRQFPAMERRLW